ncbi:unnamed protein product [Dibothriocephalus latus]|uniref:Uncharacterized protein n=1 Tax=Dibothriocephalus latus TaxID=60516 RepID=A0A3P7KVE4_DIBLA|nr:unnamed protein product [Dibothriocephalus latus]
MKLIERYASEADCEFNAIAVTLEVIRERQLKEAGLPVQPVATKLLRLLLLLAAGIEAKPAGFLIQKGLLTSQGRRWTSTPMVELLDYLISNLEEIRSQRYLNCNGIKTDDLFGFLTSIGLPMYAECLSTALNGQPPTPGNLMALSDAHLVYSLGIPVSHVSRIRQEAALIPKGLLNANPSGPSSSLLLHQKTSAKSRISRAGGCASSLAAGGVPGGVANEKHRGTEGTGGGGPHHHKKHSATRHDFNNSGGGLCERSLLHPAVENICDKV